MDCQFIMGFFAYMYYHSFIAVHSHATVGGILETAITSLSPEEQMEVVERLGRYLVGQGIVSDKVGELLGRIRQCSFWGLCADRKSGELAP